MILSIPNETTSKYFCSNNLEMKITKEIVFFSFLNHSNQNSRSTRSTNEVHEKKTYSVESDNEMNIQTNNESDTIIEDQNISVN